MKMRNRLLKTYQVVSLVFRHLAQLFSETLAFQKQSSDGDENLVAQPKYRLGGLRHKKNLGNLVYDFNTRMSPLRRTRGQMHGAILARHKSFLARLIRTNGIRFKYVSTLQLALALPIFVLKMSQSSSAHHIFKLLESQDSKQSQYTPINYSIRRQRYAQHLQKQSQSRTYNESKRQTRAFSKIRRIQITRPVQTAPQEKSQSLTKRILRKDHHWQSAAYQLEALAFSQLTNPTMTSKVLTHFPTSMLVLPVIRELEKMSRSGKQSATFILERCSAHRHDSQNSTIAANRSVTIPSKRARFKDQRSIQKLPSRKENLRAITPVVSLLKIRKEKPLKQEQEKIRGTKFTWLASPELGKIPELDKQSATFIVERHSAQRRDDQNFTVASNWSVTIPPKEGRLKDLREKQNLPTRREYLSAIATRVSLLRTRNSKRANHRQEKLMGAKFTWLVSLKLEKMPRSGKQSRTFILERYSAQRRDSQNLTIAANRSVTIPAKEVRFKNLSEKKKLLARRKKRSGYVSLDKNIQEQTESISREVRRTHTSQTLDLIRVNSARQSISQKVLNGFDNPTLIHPNRVQTQSPRSKLVETSQTDRGNFSIPMNRPRGIVDPSGINQLPDIEHLSDRVIHIIEERFKTEQERRGIFS